MGRETLALFDVDGTLTAPRKVRQTAPPPPPPPRRPAAPPRPPRARRLLLGGHARGRARSSGPPGRGRRAWAAWRGPFLLSTPHPTPPPRRSWSEGPDRTPAGRACQTVLPEMLEFMMELKKHVTVGIVGGSDLSKIKEQLGEDCVGKFDYLFSENGLMAMKGAELIAVQSLKKHLGDANLKRFINFTLKELAEIDIPVKRGTFIEFRNGMLNVSPVGRNCSQEERDAFEVHDKEHGVRKALVAKLQAEFADLNLTYSIGGQISFDVFPEGWDKTFCLQFVDKDFPTIHFFGDKTHEGGGDFELYEHERTIGHTVRDAQHTMDEVRRLLL